MPINHNILKIIEYKWLDINREKLEEKHQRKFFDCLLDIVALNRYGSKLEYTWEDVDKIPQLYCDDVMKFRDIYFEVDLDDEDAMPMSNIKPSDLGGKTWLSYCRNSKIKHHPFKWYYHIQSGNFLYNLNRRELKTIIEECNSMGIMNIKINDKYKEDELVKYIQIHRYNKQVRRLCFKMLGISCDI